ncbi:MAG: heavy-metal-associated domain-containing protein [Chloroflexi bacterium]|nr:heavy-metal-associated domain-containing protein [Chloroflexota bacterium]
MQEQLVHRAPAMFCQGCDTYMERKVRSLGGVRSVAADWKTKEVLVIFDPAQSSVQEIRRVIDAANELLAPYAEEEG